MTVSLRVERAASELNSDRACLPLALPAPRSDPHDRTRFADLLNFHRSVRLPLTHPSGARRPEIMSGTIIRQGRPASVKSSIKNADWTTGWAGRSSPLDHFFVDWQRANGKLFRHYTDAMLSCLDVPSACIPVCSSLQPPVPVTCVLGHFVADYPTARTKPPGAVLAHLQCLLWLSYADFSDIWANYGVETFFAVI